MANVARFWSLLFLALSLMPYGAHLLELPNKLDLPRDEYLIVQQIYRGWALVGVLNGGALMSMLAFVVLSRHDRRQLAVALYATVCVIASQAVFWVFTFPVNQQTRNWTQLPTAWEPLRAQWEYSHAAGASLMLTALVLMLFGVYRSLPDADCHRRQEPDAAKAELPALLTPDAQVPQSD